MHARTCTIMIGWYIWYDTWPAPVVQPRMRWMIAAFVQNWRFPRSLILLFRIGPFSCLLCMLILIFLLSVFSCPLHPLPLSHSRSRAQCTLSLFAPFLSTVPESVLIMATNSADQYLLDSSVATFILDGELWDREPYILLGHMKELHLQIERSKVSLQELETKSMTLQQSLAAFLFVQQRQSAGSPPLLITLTVCLELSRSKKVSWSIIYDLLKLHGFPPWR